MNTSVFHGHWTTSWHFQTPHPPKPQKQLILLNCQALVQCCFCIGCIPTSPNGRMKQTIERKRKINSNPNRTLSSILGGSCGCALLFSPLYDHSCPQKDKIGPGSDLQVGWEPIRLTFIPAVLMWHLPGAAWVLLSVTCQKKCCSGRAPLALSHVACSAANFSLVSLRADSRQAEKNDSSCQAALLLLHHWRPVCWVLLPASEGGHRSHLCLFGAFPVLLFLPFCRSKKNRVIYLVIYFSELFQHTLSAY